MYHPFQILIVLFLTTIISCEKDSLDEKGCPKDLLCTTEYKTITVRVINDKSEPKVLDKFIVIDTENGEDVTIPNEVYPLEIAKRDGKYPISSDGRLIFNQVKNLEFRGYINNELIIQEQYLVKEDCCGIDLISGKTTVTIDVD